MFRFTTRDVLWLTVVVAMAVGWLLERRGLRAIQQPPEKSAESP